MRPLAHQICVCFPRTQESWLPGNCYGFIKIWDFHGAEHFVLVLLPLDTLVMGPKKPWSVCVYICPVLKGDCKDNFLQYGNWLLRTTFQKEHCCKHSHTPSQMLYLCSSLKGLSKAGRAGDRITPRPFPGPSRGFTVVSFLNRGQTKWNPQKDY